MAAEANAMQDLVEEAQNSVKGRQVIFCEPKPCFLWLNVPQHVLEKLSETLQQVRRQKERENNATCKTPPSLI